METITTIKRAISFTFTVNWKQTRVQIQEEIPIDSSNDSDETDSDDDGGNDSVGDKQEINDNDETDFDGGNEIFVDSVGDSDETDSNETFFDSVSYKQLSNMQDEMNSDDDDELYSDDDGEGIYVLPYETFIDSADASNSSSTTVISDRRFTDANIRELLYKLSTATLKELTFKNVKLTDGYMDDDLTIFEFNDLQKLKFENCSSSLVRAFSRQDFKKLTTFEHKFEICSKQIGRAHV